MASGVFKLQAAVRTPSVSPGAPVTRSEYKRAWLAAYRQTPAGRAARQAAWARSTAKLRSEMLAAYGGTCACCGETEPVFLTLDHVNGDGGTERRQVTNQTSIHRRLRRLGWPQDSYRLLCWNCQYASYRGVCPHQLTTDNQLLTPR